MTNVYIMKARRAAKRQQKRDAYLLQEGTQRIAGYIRDMQIMAYTLTPGEDCTRQLGKLIWLLGLAAESELAAAGPTSRFHALHLGLLGVHAICLGGYRWPADLPASYIDTQIAFAQEVLLEHPHVVINMIPAANAMEARVLKHEVTAEDIASPAMLIGERTAA